MTASESKRQIESDLDRARERLSFYEQFDEIIKQNIISSSALLKEASARFDNDSGEERLAYRALLSGILDDVTALQAQSERLARRVSDALDDLENKMPAPGAASAVVPATLASATELTAEAPPEASAVLGAASATEKKKPEKAKPTDAKSSERPPPVAAAKPLPVVELPPTSGPASTTLLVHGVPRASAALGLKSYIEKLDFVSTVEPREFAAGMLRLQVEGSRPLALADLANWNMADRIQLRNASNDLLEVGLTPPEI